MIRIGCLAVVWAVMVSGVSFAAEQAAATRPADDEAGFVPLLTGPESKGWGIHLEGGELKPDAFYFEKDGSLACKGYGGHWYRYNAKEFENFVLRLEFKNAPKTNSGICLRSLKEGAPPFTGFEVQIFDDYGQDPHKYGCGAIYDIATPMYNQTRPPGEWNQMEITCDGPLVKIVLNGLKVIDTDFSKLTTPRGKFPFPYSTLPKKGYIALQDHWTPVWYRNFRIKELPSR